MKNNQISDMRNMLFAQLERLSDPSCNLDKEVMRSEAMTDICGVIVNSAKVEVDFMKVTSAVSTDFMPMTKGIEKAPAIQKQIGDGGN